ncbi:helix-turn-helix domain-containing protein, partial [Pseudonocardia sp. SCN 73-27]
MHLLNQIERRQPLGFQELAESVAFPRTTTHRLVAALETHG